MRVVFLSVFLAAVFTSSALANGHGRGRCGLVGYGPANPYGPTMTGELYTTPFAPTFRETAILPKVPVNSTGPAVKPVPRQGSKPSIVLPPPAPIPNPQLNPPPSTAGSTNPLPPPPTPASVKPSSAAGPPPSTSPRSP